MALSASTVWETRTTGSDTNGGGFVTGAAGTDYSQQNAAQYALTNGVTNGTTTIATVSAAADMVGNIVYVAGGTGSVTGGWYQITAQSLGVSITVDRSTGLTAGTGVTLNVGGALQTIAAALLQMSVSGMQCYVKATATYSISTALTVGSGGSTGSPTRIIGYSSTRGDRGRPVVQTTAGVNGLNVGSQGWTCENIDFNGNSTGTIAISITALYVLCFNCITRTFTAEGIKTTQSNTRIIRCEVSGCAGTTGAVALSASCYVYDSFIHDNTKVGIACQGFTLNVVLRCIVANNSGASSDGIQITISALCSNNTVYGNGRDGIRFLNAFAAIEGLTSNNLLVNNGGFGINFASAFSPQNDTSQIYNNAYYNNTSGARNNFNAEVGAVTLTGVPFTNAGGNDFSLNNTAGQGAACRGAGYPGAMIGGGTGYIDIGALQHQDSGGAAGMLFIPNMEGT